MRVDLLAGTAYNPAAMPAPVPTILVFDSGLGGLTVFAEVLEGPARRALRLCRRRCGLPYGRLSEAGRGRVIGRHEPLIEVHEPDLVVIACNTASTLVLPHLRERFSIPFVGTVPAIKPAAQLTRSMRISVLATPGTVARDYTRDLIETYAAGARSTSSARAARRLRGGGARRPPGLGRGDPGGARALLRRGAGGRTDVVALAVPITRCCSPVCTASRPGPSTWIDPAPAIARRVVQLIGRPVPGHEADEDEAVAVFTSGAGIGQRAARSLTRRGCPRGGRGHAAASGLTTDPIDFSCLFRLKHPLVRAVPTGRATLRSRGPA